MDVPYDRALLIHRIRFKILISDDVDPDAGIAACAGIIPASVQKSPSAVPDYNRVKLKAGSSATCSVSSRLWSSSASSPTTFLVQATDDISNHFSTKNATISIFSDTQGTNRNRLSIIFLGLDLEVNNQVC